MRGIDATQLTAVADPITQPYYLVYMGFSTPVRMSSSITIAWNSFTWLAAGMNVRMGQAPSLDIFNEDTLFGQLVLTDGTAGRPVIIYMGYRNDSAHPNPLMVFNGEMGEAMIGERVSIRCKPHAPYSTPRHYAVPPFVNHIPPDGTRFETPKQVVILERD